MIDICAPKGTFSESATATLLLRLTESLLRWTDSTDIPFVRRNVGAFYHELAPERVTAGGVPDVVVRIQVTVPEPVLSTVERRRGFVEDATAIVAALSGDAHTSDRTWISVTNAVDGGWGIGGRALTNADIDEI